MSLYRIAQIMGGLVVLMVGFTGCWALITVLSGVPLGAAVFFGVVGCFLLLGCFGSLGVLCLKGDER